MKYLSCLLFALVFACRPAANNDFEKLKAGLFKYASDVTELPIYADPPTGDYEEIKRGVFSFQIDSAKIPLLSIYRKELEPIILQYLDSGTSWVYLAAYLKYESAVPKIKQLLLSEDKFYGWEGGDYTTIENYLYDDQFCYQMAYVASIEYITQKPINEAIALSAEEKNKLVETAKQCVKPDSLLDEKTCAARWLLEKLSGKPELLKSMLQGLWEDKPAGGAYFLIAADSIIYPHHDLSPNIYTLSRDTIMEKDGITKSVYKYIVQKVSNDSLLLYDVCHKANIKLGRRE